MPVNIPPRPRMANETPLLAVIERLPQGVAMRPQAIDRCSPANFRAAPPEPAPQAQHRSLRDIVQIDWSGIECGVAPRRKSAPRQRDNSPAMPRLIQAQHHIDHGQAGPDDQHIRPAGGNPRYRRPAPVAPRVVDEQMLGDRARESESSRRLVALRKH
jgi:hypothetical protein